MVHGSYSLREVLYHLLHVLQSVRSWWAPLDMHTWRGVELYPLAQSFEDELWRWCWHVIVWWHLGVNCNMFPAEHIVFFYLSHMIQCHWSSLCYGHFVHFDEVASGPLPKSLAPHHIAGGSRTSVATHSLVVGWSVPFALLGVRHSACWDVSATRYWRIQLWTELQLNFISRSSCVMFSPCCSLYSRWAWCSCLHFHWKNFSVRIPEYICWLLFKDIHLIRMML